MEKIYSFFVSFLFVVANSSLAMNITTDESALLSLKSRITFDPHHALSTNWSTATPACNWMGVTCGKRNQRVIALDISGLGLVGTIPPHVGNLSFLVELNIANNSFHGDVPKDLSHLRRLRFINFNHNNFGGVPIPSWLGALSHLQSLFLYNNSFSGSLPVESLSNMTELQTLDLGANSISGSFPKEFGENLHSLKLLKMEHNQLTGFLSPLILNISSLEIIDFTNNTLSGNLPENICSRLHNLRGLFLSSNELDGGFIALSECSKLQIFSASFNNFNRGYVPTENLTVIKRLFIGDNNLNGEIQKEIGNLTSLKILAMENAGLSGLIPQEMGNLGNLQELGLKGNSLRGPIPAMIFNISTLKRIDLFSNNLSGNLPLNLGLMLPKLEVLSLGFNYLSGVVPRFISNASQLVVLEISHNKLTGSIPNTLGNLGLVEFLNVGKNNFDGCEFLTSLANCRYLRRLWIAENPLNCILPNSIGNLSSSSLRIFTADDCGLKGRIPNEIGNLSNLISLTLSRNDLTGLIPTTVKGLINLQVLHLHHNSIQGFIPNDLCHTWNLGELALLRNRLSGPIPTCLGNLTSLRNLHLDFNMLNSTIPASLFSLKDLLRLEMSSNLFTGSVPSEIASLKVLISLNLSTNRFSGNIPSSLGGLHDLIEFSLAGNELTGPVPESFGNMVGLEILDLSHNNLSGAIPNSLQSLSQLNYFNASFNRFSGPVPTGGPFASFARQSFISNGALCGGLPLLQFPPCQRSTFHRSRTKMIYLVGSSVLFVVIILFVILWIRRRSSRDRNSTPNTRTDSLRLTNAIAHERISCYELQRATDGLNESNLLGVGSFGSVYKGTLANGTIVAVKVLNMQLQDAAFKSFDVECEVLRNLRHRNLTKVVSSCSNTDFKALVFEYMPNGSLEKWLYSHNHYLDLLKRLDIVIDVASALEYLHHGYSTPVIHCDVKPSNVLLDEDMVAHLGDFGIAKLLGVGESIANTRTLATVGYIAPEYGLEGLVSRKCDVYSYGIMLMETFTRMKPCDEMFAEDLSLRSWVNNSLRADNIAEVIDTNLLRTGQQEHSLNNKKLQCLSSIMKLALRCTAESPMERMGVKDILAALKKIRLQFVEYD